MAEYVLADSGHFDAILLDTDNGPGWLARPENDRLYGTRGIRRAVEHLSEGGILGVWSSKRDRAFEGNLVRAA